MFPIYQTQCICFGTTGLIGYCFRRSQCYQVCRKLVSERVVKFRHHLMRFVLIGITTHKQWSASGVEPNALHIGAFLTCMVQYHGSASVQPPPPPNLHGHVLIMLCAASCSQRPSCKEK